MIDRFDLATERGAGMNGAYVGINQSPYRVATAFRDHPTFGPRAEAVLAMLDAGPIDSVEWAAVTKASDTMSTNLSRIDGTVAGDVVWHAYVVTMCNLHVLLGYPIGMGIPTRNRFRG